MSLVAKIIYSYRPPARKDNILFFGFSDSLFSIRLKVESRLKTPKTRWVVADFSGLASPSLMIHHQAIVGNDTMQN